MQIGDFESTYVEQLICSRKTGRIEMVEICDCAQKLCAVYIAFGYRNGVTEERLNRMGWDLIERSDYTGLPDQLPQVRYYRDAAR